MARWLRAALWIMASSTVLILAARMIGNGFSNGSMLTYNVYIATNPDYRMGVILEDSEHHLRQIASGPDSSSRFSGVWSADGQHFVYEDRGDLYLMSMADMKPHNITQSPDVEEMFPTVSPDGERVAFVFYTGSWDEGTASYYAGVVDVPTHHTTIIDLSGIYERGLSWSPDGKLLAASDWVHPESSAQLQILKVDGQTVTPFITISGHNPGNPRWSPTHNWLVYAAYSRKIVSESASSITYQGIQEIWFVDADTGVNRRLEEDFMTLPVWSPNGEHIAYTVYKPNSATPQYQAVIVMDVQTGDKRQLTPAGHNDSHPTWSPDGESLVVVADPDWPYQPVVQVNVLTGERQPIVTLEDYVSGLSWSHNGRWLAVYTSHRPNNASTDAFDRTHIVDVANRAVVAHMDRFQAAFDWQP